MGRPPKDATLYSIKLENRLRQKIEEAKPPEMSLARFLEWAAWYFVERRKLPPEPKR